MFGAECVTTKQAMVVSFLSTTTIFTINNEHEIGVCAMCSRHLPVNRYFAKSLEPESRGRCLVQVVMDDFFDVAYQHDQAGKRHYYIAVRWSHRFQGKWISYAIFFGSCHYESQHGAESWLLSAYSPCCTSRDIIDTCLKKH